ncbi:MAG: arylformamidase [Chitinophagales bacterium]|nr:MAG: arylformamidase [Chitinophagales bacterium]
MKALIQHPSGNYTVHLDQGIDISIPVSADSAGVRAFHAPLPEFSPVISDSFTGSVQAGSPVNFFNVKVNPHGNGTHTECVGHITADRISVNRCLRRFFFIARLISVAPVRQANGDFVIMPDAVKAQLTDTAVEAVILRTLPNDDSKLNRNYSGTNPPYLHPEVTGLLAARSILHLLVDLPSVDKESDGGLLAAHKAFWGYPDNVRTEATITELVYVPSKVADGLYLLNLQLAAFELDAAPSRPILFGLQPAAPA